MAKDLIEELAGRGVDTTMLEVSALIATNQKETLDMAEKSLKALISKNQGYVPGLVQMALVKLYKGHTGEAKTILYKCNQLEFQLENSHYHEKGWLMSADQNISTNSFTQAEADLSKVLKHNKSNVKAQELMGLIKERQKDHASAVEHYLHAWKMSNNKNASVGFRLAFNYLKSGRYTDTIDVGRQILSVYTDFPQVKAEIISKARQNIRA